MTEVLSQTYGRPGTPGNVEVAYLHGLRGGDKLTVKVGFPGKGGAGGPPAEPSSDGDPNLLIVAVQEVDVRISPSLTPSQHTQRAIRTLKRNHCASWSRESTKLSGPTILQQGL